jgi:hypothetical protein
VNFQEDLLCRTVTIAVDDSIGDDLADGEANRGARLPSKSGSSREINNGGLGRFNASARRIECVTETFHRAPLYRLVLLPIALICHIVKRTPKAISA